MNTNKIQINTSFPIMLILVVWILSLYSCNPSSDNDLQQEHTNTYLNDEEMEAYAAWEKEQADYTKFHQDLLTKVDDRIELLEKRMDELSLKKQAIAREKVRHLEAQREILQSKLHELEEANEQNWAKLKQEIDQVADSLEVNLEKIDKNVEFGSIWLIHQ